MPQSLSCILIHAVFSTKKRHPFLADPDFRSEVHAYIGGISKRLGCPPVAIGGVEDHVHALVWFSRTVTVADWIKEIKRVSCSFAKGREPRFGWQAGYGVYSVDLHGLDCAAAYVRNQEQHHKKVTFQEELRQLMAEHGLEWDERYIWD